MLTALAVLTAAAAGAASIALAFKNIKGLQPVGRRLIRDLAVMEKSVRARYPELAPFTEEEVKLFSFNILERQKPRRRSPFETGSLGNIFQEATVAYARKRYKSRSYRELIYARTDRHEFYYRESKRDGIEVAIDDKLIGFFDRRNKRLLKPSKKEAYIESRPAAGELLTLFSSKGKELASVYMRPEEGNPNPRVFAFVSPLTEKEHTLLLAFAIYYVLSQQT